MRGQNQRMTTMRNDLNGVRISTIIKCLGLLLLFIIGFSMASSVVETVGAGEIVIMQDPVDGDLHVWTQPGLRYQNFGKITHYKKSDQYWFSDKADEGKEKDESISVRFNDGGHASISGSLRYDLPTDMEHMIRLHSIYGSQEAIERNLLRPIINRAVYMTGPLLSSKESSAERRGDLISYIDDQILNGVYRTVQEEKKVIDPLTGHEKNITIVKLVMDPKSPGNFARQERSTLDDFGIRVYNISITKVNYSEQVESQIQQQQKALMEVQLAIAHAKRAEQDAITNEKEGQAQAAKARWAQEVKKAEAVTAAQQAKEVAELKAQQDKSVAELDALKEKNVAHLNMEAAKDTRAEQIMLGEGEAARARAKMVANGSLELKLAAWEKVNMAYAEALGKQAQVPGIVISGSGNGTTGNPISNLIPLLMAKTARDLELQMNNK